MMYKIHFFKQGNRNFDNKRLYEYLKSYYKISDISTDKENIYQIINENTNLEIYLYSNSKSYINDIFRINPEYLDINFRLEVDILTSTYNIEIVFNLIRRITKEFNLFIYNELFKNVSNFSIDLLRTSFNKIKQAYKTKYVDRLNYYYLDSQKLYDIDKFFDEIDEIYNNFNEDTEIVKPKFLLDENNKVLISLDWKEQQAIIFPPFLDLIIYQIGNKVLIIKANIVFQTIEKYINDLPGFSKGAYYISKKNSKKCKKLISKLSNVQLDINLKYLPYKNITD